jgi:hypothetical protein
MNEYQKKMLSFMGNPFAPIEEQEPKIGGQKMNREDVIRMAREAGLSGLMEGGLIDYFERFAGLVAADEREACAKVPDEYPVVEQAKSVTLGVAARIRARGNNE